MIIAAEMEQPVDNQLSNFSIVRQSVFFCLNHSSLNRDRNVAEIRIFLGWKRQNIRCFINPAKLAIQFSNPFV